MPLMLSSLAFPRAVDRKRRSARPDFEALENRVALSGAGSASTVFGTISGQVVDASTRPG
jgi:hypothetical protein